VETADSAVFDRYLAFNFTVHLPQLPL